MATKITSKIFKFGTVKSMFLLLLWLCSTGAFAQIIVVEKVSPKIVTTKNVITITGGSGFTNNTVVSLSGIAIGSKIASNNGTQLSFTVIREEFDSAGDVSPTVLKIDGKEVYEEAHIANQLVKIKYVGPSKKDYNAFRVIEVFTSWDKDGTSFWRSGRSGTGGEPNDRHDLLAFTTATGTYSTGVADHILTNNNIPVFEKEIFKAYSTRGIAGNTHDQNYLAMADLIDGKANEVLTNDLIRATVYDVLIDGQHGLNMGTGITNLNRNAEVKFYSGNGALAGLNDIPDLLITQIADPGLPDIYYYADIDNNVVGRPIYLEISKSSPKLFDWRVDLYNMKLGQSYDDSYPIGAGFSAKQKRAFRMVAFRLRDFDINSELQLEEINNIRMMAGGQADIAFLAYNTATFAIKSPRIDEFPVSRNICELSNAIEVTYKTKASVENHDINDIREDLKYQWYKNFKPISGATSSNYTLPHPILESDLTIYKVRVSNQFGAVDLSATLSKGGVPTYWYGPTEGWVFPSNYYNGPIHSTANLKFPIDNADRNLIFAADYNEKTDLEGCDCVVLSGKNATISANTTLKLYNAIIVEDEVPANHETGLPYIPAGTFTLENSASLIQIKEDVLNTGNIIAKRDALTQNKYDYVYWSSPVQNGNLSMIPGATSHVYEWDPNATNRGTTILGNWVKPISNVMQNGRGYIKRFNNPTTVNSEFIGIPNNGTISVDVLKTGSIPAGSTDTNAHQNLIGNPYPSAIFAKKFFEENTDLEGHVLIWAHDTDVMKTEAINPFYGNYKYNYGDQYMTYNLVGATPLKDKTFEGYIASGQGFFVKVKNESSPTSTVHFNNKMRYDENQNSYDNTQFYRGTQYEVKNTGNKELLWLSLVNEQFLSSTILVGYVEGATHGKDRLYDVMSTGGKMRLYSVIEEGDFLIQGRPLPFHDSDEIILGIEILKNGIYKIAIDHLKGDLMEKDRQNFFLEDQYTNTSHDLRTSPYSFTATVGDFKDRFVLRYADRSLSVEDHHMSNTFAFVRNAQLYVRADKNIERVIVYDLTGNQLLDFKAKDFAEAINTPFQFSKGVYIIEIKLENSGAITKKIVN